MRTGSFRLGLACLTLRQRAQLMIVWSALGLLAGSLLAEEASGNASDTSAEKESKLPLESSDTLRTFTLETDEVTWMSVDIFPDGKTLVTEVLGDLYTLPASGGTATPLTHGMAFDAQPATSPDGAYIAFVSDRDGADNIWILPTDGGEPRQLTKDKTTDFLSPTWSADSEYVIYSRAARGMRTYELWMSHRDGGTGVQITKAKPTPDTPRDRQHNAMGAVASSDGRFLYYARKFGGFSYNASFPMWQIARRNLVDGVEDVLTSAQGSAVRPALSPDGKTLVFATRLDNATGFKVRDLESGEERWLAYPVTRDDQESRGTRDQMPGYTFTPEGDALIASWGGKLHRLDVLSGASMPIPFTVKINKKLGPSLRFPQRVENGPVRARTVQGAEESPTGETIVFSALTRIYRTERGAKGAAKRLSPEGQRAFQPTFSPDGRSVVYVTWAKEGGHIWQVPLAGGSPQRLTAKPAFYAEPTVSPDGERVVFRRGSRSDRLEMPAEFGGSPIPLDLAWVTTSGGPSEANLIAPSRGLGRPHFGPEPDRVYVASTEGLVSMRFDGSDRRVHLQVTGPGLYFSSEPVPAQDLRIRPDGKWVLARVSNRFFAVALPRVGGAPPKVNVLSPSVPVKQLSKLGADGMVWVDGGASIGWTVGPSYFRTTFSDLEFVKPEEEPEDETAAEGASESEDAAGSEEETKPPEVDFPDFERTELVAELPRAEPKGSVVLRGARVVTMAEGAENGGVIDNADVVITGRRIVGIGPSGSVAVPRTATVIDVTGKTILPGLIDTHAHWTEIRRNVLDTEAWPFLATLAWGVTTGLDVQTMTNDMFAYQDLIDAGEVMGPRTYNTGPGIFSDNDFQSKAEVEAVLRRYRDQYRTRNLKAYIAGNRKQRQWIVSVAHELEMMPTTEGSLDFKLDMTHAIDGFSGTEHSLPLMPLYRDTVELVAQSGMSYTPTLLVAYGGPWAENYFYTHGDVHNNEKLRRFMPHDLVDGVTRKRNWFRDGEQVFGKIAEGAAAIHRAGGLVGVGAHGQLQGLGYHWEMQALAAGGLSPLEVLRIATLQGAEVIGLAQDLGSLEEGKIADLIVVDGDPLADISNTQLLALVMKNGVVYEADTLDQVWPETKALEKQWWWDAWPSVAADTAEH